jgi:hypothetical protein
LAACGLAATTGALKPPLELRGEPQDRQAIRLSWKRNGPNAGYRLYAAIHREPFDFHRETETPLTQEFVIWDAPRIAEKTFVFYVTSVAPDGRESRPSNQVVVSLEKQRNDPRPSQAR